ncbi:MAG TPA: SUMF1/EgtB/PvdO family nonheme iron enzyme [bacterium]|nr:SUMF1/EgtB/PvdO family nonheme iron enzyme [bacterium]
MKKKIIRYTLIIFGLISGILLIYLGGAEESHFFIFKNNTEKKENITEPAPAPVIIKSDLENNNLAENSSDTQETDIQIPKTDTSIIELPKLTVIQSPAQEIIKPPVEITTTPEPISSNIQIQQQPEFDTTNMVLISAGNFVFGKDDFQKNIFVDAFYIDKYEVTNEEFKKVFTNFKFKQGDEKKPVSGIAYSEALEYAKRKNKDLPTVFEWEKAASWNANAKEKYIYPWGNEFKNNYTNYSDNSDFIFDEVEGKKYKDISPCGVVFMAGNISEWTKTTVAELVKIVPANNIDNINTFRQENTNNYKFGIIVKGGSIFDGKSKLTTTYYYAADGTGQTGIGFRCVYRLKK